MSDNQNPWDNRGKKPTELEDMIQQGLKKLFGNKSGGPTPPAGSGSGSQPPKKGFISIIALAAIIGLVLMQSFYQIGQSELGVVLKFGKYSETTDPGLHFLIPFVEKVIKVNVESIRKEEFGTRQNAPSAYNKQSNFSDLESLMITSDNNVIQLNWVVQYRILKPEDYLFNVQDPVAAVRDLSEAVIRRLVGNRDFNYTLNNREELATSSFREIQENLDLYKSGVKLVTVQLQDLNPPDPVRPSFNEVNQAEQDKVRLGNEAQKERNEKIPKAEGVAKQMLEEAQGYAIERVNNAKGNIARYNSIFNEYKKYKEVTKTRMYIEALKEVLPTVKEVIIMDQKKNGMLPIINLGGSNAIKQIN
jgi:modulator of FtsH protease HflK